MTPAKPGEPGVTDYALLLLLAVTWGGSFLIIKLAVGTVPPMTLTALRLAIAAVCLLCAMALAGESLASLKGYWRGVFLAGFFGNTLPFFLISWGEEHIDTALTAILMAVMPLTTVILAHLFTADEKLTPGKLLGVALGFAGLVVLIGPATLLQLGEDSVRQLAVAGAAVCYGINALITKRLSSRPPIALAAAIICSSVLIATPASFILEAPLTITPSSQAIWATAILGVLQTAFATLLLVTIVQRQGASFFSQINFLIPVIGVILGAVILGETIGLNAVFALLLILAGIAITRYAGRMSTGRRPRTPSRVPAANRVPATSQAPARRRSRHDRQAR